MTATSGLGLLTGIAWCCLGKRGQKYLDAYKEKAQAIEKSGDLADLWEKDIPLPYRPFQVKLKTLRISSSKFLLWFIPLLFAVVHVVLMISVWM